MGAVGNDLGDGAGAGAGGHAGGNDRRRLLGVRPRADGEPYPTLPYAGEFTALDAKGWTRSRFAAVRTRHRFRADYVETQWLLVPRTRTGRHSVRAQFPSWGAAAEIVLHLRGGGSEVVGAAGDRDLADVAWVEVRSVGSGYVVAPVGRFPPASVFLAHPRSQAANPHPGPTLVAELLSGERLRRLALSVRIAPARDAAEARRVAARLAR